MKNEQEAQLRRRVRELLNRGTVEVLLGYGRGLTGVRPLFVRDPANAEKLIWNEHCNLNLAGYLVREPLKQVMAGARIGLIVKGCDFRAVNVLIQEHQVERQNIYLIGMVCNGIESDSGSGILIKCRGCNVQVPEGTDEVIGNPQELRQIDGDPFEDVRAIMEMSLPERWSFWTSTLSRCIKCYACRQACPLCYCEECITEKSRPQWIEKAPTLSGNLAYHFIRTMHLAGRCVACGECSRACPVDIPVDVLTRFVALTIKERFDYVAGDEPDGKPFLASYCEDDPDDFIK